MLLPALLVVLGAGSVYAQDTKTDTRSLVFGVRTETAYEKNPLFVTDGPNDLSTRLSGAGALVLAARRADLSLGGQVDRSFYRRIKQLNQFTYSGNGTAHYSVTPRFALQAAGSYATLVISGQNGVDGVGGNVAPVAPTTITPPVATPNSVAVPSTMFHTLSGAGSAAYALTARTASQVQVSYSQVRFDTSGVPDGSTLSAGGTIQHSYSERAAFGVVYGFQTNNGVAEARTTHSVLGSWGGIYERIRLGLQAGVVANETSEKTAFTGGGGAQLDYRLQRGSVAFRYDRSAEQAFGLGRVLITDHGSVGLTQTYGKYALHVGGTASRGRDSEVKSYKLDMYSAEMGLERSLLANIRLMASVYYRKRSELVSTDDNGVRMLLTYDGHYF